MPQRSKLSRLCSAASNPQFPLGKNKSVSKGKCPHLNGGRNAPVRLGCVGSRVWDTSPGKVVPARANQLGAFRDNLATFTKLVRSEFACDSASAFLIIVVSRESSSRITPSRRPTVDASYCPERLPGITSVLHETEAGNPTGTPGEWSPAFQWVSFACESKHAVILHILS